MKKKWFFLAPPAIALFITLFIVIGGEVVMHLWNWLLPMLFGWRLITFWQAVGILALCRILFGRWGGRGFPRSTFRRRMGGRWERMSAEEREKVREILRSGCASGSASNAKGST